MKFYLIQSIESDQNGIVAITWHKHIFINRDEAFKNALERGPTTWVIEVTETDSWTPEEVNDFAPYPGG